MDINNHWWLWWVASTSLYFIVINVIDVLWLLASQTVFFLSDSKTRPSFCTFRELHFPIWASLSSYARLTIQACTKSFTVQSAVHYCLPLFWEGAMSDNYFDQITYPFDLLLSQVCPLVLELILWYYGVVSMTLFIDLWYYYDMSNLI